MNIEPARESSSEPVIDDEWEEHIVESYFDHTSINLEPIWSLAKSSLRLSEYSVFNLAEFDWSKSRSLEPVETKRIQGCKKWNHTEEFGLSEQMEEFCEEFRDLETGDSLSIRVVYPRSSWYGYEMFFSDEKPWMCFYGIRNEAEGRVWSSRILQVVVHDQKVKLFDQAESVELVKIVRHIGRNLYWVGRRTKKPVQTSLEPNIQEKKSKEEEEACLFKSPGLQMVLNMPTKYTRFLNFAMHPQGKYLVTGDWNQDLQAGELASFNLRTKEEFANTTFKGEDCKHLFAFERYLVAVWRHRSLIVRLHSYRSKEVHRLPELKVEVYDISAFAWRGINFILLGITPAADNKKKMKNRDFFQLIGLRRAKLSVLLSQESQDYLRRSVFKPFASTKNGIVLLQRGGFDGQGPYSEKKYSIVIKV